MGSATVGAGVTSAKLQSELIAAGVRTGVDTAINGGDLGENMIANLQGAAVHALGAQMANEIGAAYKNGDINKASQYIAHAALGGAMDVALGGDGTSGAVGAVVGEATGDLFVETYINDKLTSSTFKSSQEFQKEVQKLQATGVNLARLGAGLAAAVAGGNINIASQTGGNAAKNNALVCTVVAVALASLEVADKAITAYDAWRLAKAVHDGDTDTAAEVGAEIALGMATDAIPGDKVAILLGNTLSKVGLFALGTKLVGKYGKDVAKLVAKVDPSLLDELASKGIKHTPEEILFTHKLPNGTISFLERGDSKKGLVHIIERHANDFEQKGVSSADIPELISKTISAQSPLFKTKSGLSVYRVSYKGKMFDLGVVIGDNGFIVTSYPWSR